MKKLLAISCVLVLITALLCGCIAEELPEEESRPETTTTTALTTFSTAPTTTITQATAETTSMTTQDTTTGVTAVPSTTVVTTVVTVTVTQTGTATQTQPGQPSTKPIIRGTGFKKKHSLSRGPATGTVDNFYAELWFTSQVYICAYRGTDSVVSVPTELDGYTVTSFDFWCFVSSPTVDTVYLPQAEMIEVIFERAGYRPFHKENGVGNFHHPATWHIPEQAASWRWDGGSDTIQWKADFFWQAGGALEQHVYVPKTLAFDCSYMEEHSLLLEKTEQGDTVTYHMNGDEEYGIQPTTFTVHYYE